MAVRFVTGKALDVQKQWQPGLPLRVSRFVLTWAPSGLPPSRP